MNGPCSRFCNRVHDENSSFCGSGHSSRISLVGKGIWEKKDRAVSDDSFPTWVDNWQSNSRLSNNEEMEEARTKPETQSRRESRHHLYFSSDIDQMICDLNGQVASLRQLLITIGQPKDSPENREKIRRLRRQCVDACKHTNQLLLPQIHNDIAAGIPVDKDHLVHFFCCTQLLARELRKSYRLIQTRPLDMTTYYENRPGPSSLGGVLSQIILCKQLAPDFNQEELCSIRKDAEDIQRLIDDMQEFMPMEESNGRAFALAGEDKFSLWAKKRMKSRPHSNPLYRSIRAFCCLSKPSYLV